jgi:hypothetical protein
MFTGGYTASDKAAHTPVGGSLRQGLYYYIVFTDSVNDSANIHPFVTSHYHSYSCFRCQYYVSEAAQDEKWVRAVYTEGNAILVTSCGAFIT